MNLQETPLVSICTMSKNLEGIIADGFDSWLAQQTDFNFEIVLSDDFSTDKTVAVVQQYADAHPGKVRVLTTDKPLGLGKNWVKCMRACRGKYIAFCDGDDLWTDPLKLQKQIGYLEAHPDCNLVCADYDYLSEKGDFIVSEWKQNWYDRTFDIVDNLEHSVATTLTVVIRKSTLQPLLDRKPQPFIWDTVLWAYTLRNGYGYFFPEKMALRRVQADGIYTTKSVIGRAPYDYGSIESLKLLIKDERIQKFARKSLYALNLAIAKEYFSLGKKSKGRTHLLKWALKWNGASSIGDNLKYGIRFVKSFATRMV